MFPLQGVSSCIRGGGLRGIHWGCSHSLQKYEHFFSHDEWILDLDFSVHI